MRIAEACLGRNIPRWALLHRSWKGTILRLSRYGLIRMNWISVISVSWSKITSGRLWVSIYGGVGLFNPENGQINLLSEQFPELKKYKVANALAIDNQSRLVVGSDNGLYIYDPATIKYGYRRKMARLILYSIREVSSIIRYSKTMRELYGLLHNMA